MKSTILSYKLVEQRVYLNVNVIEKLLEGTVEMTIIPKKNIATIAINTGQNYIKSVRVNGEDCVFKVNENFDVPVNRSYGMTNHLTFMNANKKEKRVSDKGELVIDVPNSLKDILNRGKPKEGYHPVEVIIEYQSTSRNGGAYFIESESNPYMYVYNGNGARYWMPCVDSHTAKCKWKIEITIPVAPGDDYVAVASGDLYRVEEKEVTSSRTYYYKEDKLTAAPLILFTVGCYEKLPYYNFDGSIVTLFCLPEHIEDLQYTTKFLIEAYYFFKDYLGFPFPYNSYKQVYIDTNYSVLHYGNSLSILSSDLLYSPTIIDQTFESRKIISLALLQQWFGSYISVKNLNDSWITTGISGYLSYLLYCKMFGEEDFKHILYRDILYVSFNSEKMVLNSPDNNYLPCIVETDLYQKKSILTMYLLETHIQKNEFQRLTASILEMFGDKPSSLDTDKFFKILDLMNYENFESESFKNQWISTSEYPHLNSGVFYGIESKVLNLSIVQDPRISTPVSGKIDVELHQKGHVNPYKYALPINQENNSFSFQIYSLINHDDGSFPMNSILVDPAMKWLKTKTECKPIEMWLHQLKTGTLNDILDAIKNVYQFPEKKTIEALNYVITNENLHYSVRVKAAEMVAMLTSRDDEWCGLESLFKFYRSRYFNEECFLNDNDFSIISNYYLKVGVQNAISKINGKLNRGKGSTPSDVIDFLIYLLSNNDNEKNEYSDCFYISSIIGSIKNIEDPHPQYKSTVKDIIKKYLNDSDSFHDVIKTNCLDSLCFIQKENWVTDQSDVFLQHTDENYSHFIRHTAVKNLVYLGLTNVLQNGKSAIEHILHLIRIEKSPYLKYKFIQCMVEPHDYDLSEYPFPRRRNVHYFGAEFRERFHFILDEDDTIARNSRDTVWSFLNSNFSGSDSRIRMALLQLFTLLGGNKIITVKPRKEEQAEPLEVDDVDEDEDFTSPKKRKRDNDSPKRKRKRKKSEKDETKKEKGDKKKKRKSKKSKSEKEEKGIGRGFKEPARKTMGVGYKKPKEVPMPLKKEKKNKVDKTKLTRISYQLDDIDIEELEFPKLKKILLKFDDSEPSDQTFPKITF